MTTKRAATAVASMFFSAALVANAGQLINNGGFETGDFTGWSAAAQGGSSGSFAVSSGTGGGIGTVGAASGTYYALTGQDGPGAYSLSQAFTVGAGSSVVLSFNMFVNSYGPLAVGALDYTGSGVEFATVDLLTGTANSFSTAGGDVVRNFYQGIDSGTNPHAYTAYIFDISTDVAAGGTFTVRFGEADNQGFFNLGVDNVSIVETSNATPEPATALLLIPALGGFYLRRRGQNS